MSGHTRWADVRAKVMADPEFRAGYEAARVRYELGKKVREQREKLGLTQTQLAKLTGLKQPAVARFEAGGTMPTIPMLERFAAALGMELLVELRIPAERSGMVNAAGEVG